MTSRAVSITRRIIQLVAVIVAALSSQVVSAQAPYWHTAGTVTHVLQNNALDNGQVINEVDLMTNQNTRMRLLSNGQFHIFPISGTIIGTTHQMQFATIQAQGGNVSALAAYTAQTQDWGQNIQSYVTRPLTVSYVVSWNGTDRFYVAGQGWLYANGAWFASDASLKENVKPIAGAVGKVMRLRGVTFQWKDEKPCEKCPPWTSVKVDKPTEIGFVAQDIETVVPEAVRAMADGTKAVSYQNLVALLAEAIKEQQQTLEQQAATLKSLQERLAKVESARR